MKNKFIIKKWGLTVLLAIYSIIAYAQTPTTDLSAYEPNASPPSGATFEWREGAAPSSALVSTPSAVPPGVYYGYYNFGGGCFSEASPIGIFSNTCPTETLDLNSVVNTPNGDESFHSALPVSDANEITGTAITAATTGTTYYVAYKTTVNGASCYSAASPIVVVGTNCIDPCNAAASGNLDTDGDGISDICDFDDDNDGILDTDECPTTSLLFDIGWNSNKSPFNEQDGVWQDPSDGTSNFATLTYWDDGQTGVDTSVISGQGSHYVIGAGLIDFVNGTSIDSDYLTAQELGDVESNLALAKTDGDYIDYSFQTGSFVSAGINNLGTASWDGYNFSMYAEIYETAAGAGTATLLLPEVL
ncbi:MAG: thrombospondin type 3 repeat-containing protein, partial [Saprospiraceae bacterium]